MNNLQKIQKYLKENNISLFIVNRTDEFLNEYIAPYAERLEWISNFSGSAGRAIIQQNKAFFFIDGRYTFQAHKQVDSQYYNIEHLKNYWKFLENNIEINSSIGIDPTLHSNSDIKRIEELAKKKQSFIKYLEKNPNIFEKITSILFQNNMENFLKIYELFVKHKDDEKFKNIKSKTLIMTGENDIGSTPEMSRNLSKEIAHSKVEIVSQGKHLCGIECADDVNKTIKEFIQND